MEAFSPSELKNLYRPPRDSGGEDNGQVTVVAGSELFHGPPVLILKTISRVVDMVFFSSPEPTMRDVAANLKSQVGAFIWVPWHEVGEYIEKSDACLIGPGFMRFRSEKAPHGDRVHRCDRACWVSRMITECFLRDYSHKKWVIDAGALQVMDRQWIPSGSILTPNKKEYELLFGKNEVSEMAREWDCTIAVKGEVTVVCSPGQCVEVSGGNPGLTKGGTGDVQSGLTAALLAKNDPFLAACAASYVVKMAAERLEESTGIYYSADDLAEAVPSVLGELTKQ